MKTSIRAFIGLSAATLLGTTAYLTRPGLPAASPAKSTEVRTEFRIDGKTSRLTVETETVGLSSMFGHDHKFVARDFTGVITFVPGAPESATLGLKVRGDALALIEDLGDDAHREIATALREAVLETGKYPEISFRSRSVTASRNDDGSFEVKVAGDLDLHGVRRKITVPAHVTLSPGGIRAIGALELRQSDFKIKPYTFARGTVRVRDYVALSFDLVGKR
jgi:polyisoprenoid-binding protein YceI